MIAKNICKTDFGTIAPFDLSKIVSQYCEWSKNYSKSTLSHDCNRHLIFTECIQLISTGRGIFHITNANGSSSPLNLQFSPSNSTYTKFLDFNFIISNQTNEIYLYDIIQGESQIKFSGHDFEINHLNKFNEHCFMSASDDKSIKLWDSRYHKSVQTFHGHSNEVVFTTPLSSLMFVSQDEKQMKIWDIRMSEKSVSSIDLSLRPKNFPHLLLCIQPPNFILTLHLNDIKSPLLQLYDINKGYCISAMNMPKTKNLGGRFNLFLLPDSRIIYQSPDEIRVCNFNDCDILDESKFQQNTVLIEDHILSFQTKCHLHENGFVIFDRQELRFYS